MLLPAIVLLLWIAVPLGWVGEPSYPSLLALLGNPWARLFLLVLVTLCLFHWAHRFRYTLYDGLQLYHLNLLIATITYGIATLLTVIAAYLLWAFG